MKFDILDDMKTVLAIFHNDKWQDFKYNFCQFILGNCPLTVTEENKRETAKKFYNEFARIIIEDIAYQFKTVNDRMFSKLLHGVRLDFNKQDSSENAKVLFSVDRIARSISDEYIGEKWLAYGVPDGCESVSDILDFVDCDDEQTYKDLIQLFVCLIFEAVFDNRDRFLHGKEPHYDGWVCYE